MAYLRVRLMHLATGEQRDFRWFVYSGLLMHPNQRTYWGHVLRRRLHVWELSGWTTESGTSEACTLWMRVS